MGENVASVARVVRFPIVRSQPCMLLCYYSAITGVHFHGALCIVSSHQFFILVESSDVSSVDGLETSV